MSNNRGLGSDVTGSLFHGHDRFRSTYLSNARTMIIPLHRHLSITVLSPRHMQVTMDSSLNQRDALEVGVLSLGIILFITLLLQTLRMRAHGYRTQRGSGLYQDSVCPGLTEAIKAAEDAIAKLECLERRLAEEYGIVGNIDSVEVFDQAKFRAFTQMGAGWRENLMNLGTLHDLRLQLAGLRQSASGNTSTGSRNTCTV
ncbi:hypothetical protein IW261DRAFT_351284 [Armillaria novae-zelandiae]|uniref:Uncharacterized protein n=1 Tax=Armillaria novae-zelandiae TaxID=153914 RepID=A0AA39TH40_9AGAR|nr:hypothetical protein IW261DRAFT_351284 [Armillaria novae-zelandiae]